MKPKAVKRALNEAIQAVTDYKWLYSVRPGKDNTRDRKFPFKKMISSILAFRGGTLNREIMDFFGLDPTSEPPLLLFSNVPRFFQKHLTPSFGTLRARWTKASHFMDFDCWLLTDLICRLPQTLTTRIPITLVQTVRKPIICCISTLCMICFSILIRMLSSRKAETQMNPVGAYRYGRSFRNRTGTPAR